VWCSLVASRTNGGSTSPTGNIAARRLNGWPWLTTANPLDPSSWPLLYEPTGQVRSHRTAEKLLGRVWRWVGPPGVRTMKDLKRARLEAERKATTR
jgi:hypothetical protein